jgi:hypothetical protein
VWNDDAKAAGQTDQSELVVGAGVIGLIGMGVNLPSQEFIGLEALAVEGEDGLAVDLDQEALGTRVARLLGYERTAKGNGATILADGCGEDKENLGALATSDPHDLHALLGEVAG